MRQQNGRPCHHVIAAFKRHDVMTQVALNLVHKIAFFKWAFDPIFTVDQYAKAVGTLEVFLPQRDDLVADGVTLPPPLTKAVGRHQTKRHRKVGEPGSRPRKMALYACRDCGSMDHNRQNCLRPRLPDVIVIDE